jgi:hypothetical protein
MKPSGSDNPDPTLFLRIRHFRIQQSNFYGSGYFLKHSDPQLQFSSGSSNNCPVQSCFVGSLQPAIQLVTTPFLAGQMIKFSDSKNRNFNNFFNCGGIQGFFMACGLGLVLY